MRPSPPPATSSRVPGIDLLRALCILYIVGYWHLIPYTTAFPGYANGFTEGLKYLTLATFVFCSGWLLAGRPVALTRDGLAEFYRRRLARIYPLYALALGLFGIAGLASARQLFDAALLISMFNPPALPTLWFVTMIMLFYLLAPLLIRAAARPSLALLAGGGCWALLAGAHTWVAPIDPRVLLYWPVFVLAILYRARPGLAAWLGARPWRQGALAALAALSLALSATGHEWSIAGLAPILPLTLLGALACFMVAEPIARRLHAPTIGFLAYASFGLYLFHRPLFAALIGVYFPAQGEWQLVYLLALGLPLAILAGAGLQYGYDRLAAAWARRAGG